MESLQRLFRCLRTFVLTVAHELFQQKCGSWKRLIMKGHSISVTLANGYGLKISMLFCVELHQAQGRLA